MNRTTRGPAPALLAQHGVEIGLEYARRRRTEPSYRYQWPQRAGQRLYDVAHAALREMTHGRCSYCDGYPLGAVGEDQIDHFRPKALPAFYELVCSWSNLFLICVACNKAKLDAWHELLLRPDVEDYSFDRYFEYHFDTGELHPSGAASEDDQARAAKTIELLNLNRADACVCRKRTVRWLRTARAADDLIDADYRFLIPLCSL